MADQIVFMRSIINSRTLKELQYAKSVFAGAASISQGVIYLLSDNIPTSVPKTIVLGMFSDMESDINGITAKSYGWNVIYNKSFHAKILIIEKKKSHVIYMGSSNLTGAANNLALNLEMNIRYECKNLPSQIRKLIKECKNSTSNLDEKVLNNNLTLMLINR